MNKKGWVLHELENTQNDKKYYSIHRLLEESKNLGIDLKVFSLKDIEFINNNGVIIGGDFFNLPDFRLNVKNVC